MEQGEIQREENHQDKIDDLALVQAEGVNGAGEVLFVIELVPLLVARRVRVEYEQRCRAERFSVIHPFEPHQRSYFFSMRPYAQNSEYKRDSTQQRRELHVL